MIQCGDTTIETADKLQFAARQRFTEGALHMIGEGSHGWYRRGCRCGECRAANAAKRAAEREQSRLRTAA